jgi:RNA polymerase sporulation-specific sigma factor
MGKSRPSKRDGKIEGLDYKDLIEIVKGRARKDRKNFAYEEIEKRMKLKVFYITRQFYIPGLNVDDIFQEALFALRFKAIPDYDESKSSSGIPYPFDKFAILCIRRHLSTLLKSSFQNKRKTLNTSLSLDQDRGSYEDDNLYLVDILPVTEGSIIEEITNKEYYKDLFNKLYEKLSKLEKEVFVLYTYKYSYEDINKKINKVYKKRGSKRKINIKSIDNAISRIKQKGKEIINNYEEEEN